MNWISQLLGLIPRSALGPPGPHPNEALAGVDPLQMSAVVIDGIIRADWPARPVVPIGMRAALNRYGDPGRNDGAPDKAWERENMVVARDLPGTWNNSPSGKCKLYVHRLVEPSLRETLVRLEKAGLIGQVKTLGCFSFRRIRHQKTGPLSYHSFGAAVDVNANANFGVVNHPKFISRQNQPVPKQPFSEEWRRIWPEGVGEDLVAAFEATGFEWGGRWRGYVDPMHFQLVRT